MIVARQAFGLGDALVLFRRFQNGAVAKLADETALDFLPGRLVLGELVAALRLERGAASGNFLIRDQDVGFTLIEVDADPIPGLENGEIAAGGGGQASRALSTRAAASWIRKIREGPSSVSQISGHGTRSARKRLRAKGMA